MPRIASASRRRGHCWTTHDRLRTSALPTESETHDQVGDGQGEESHKAFSFGRIHCQSPSAASDHFKQPGNISPDFIGGQRPIPLVSSRRSASPMEQAALDANPTSMLEFLQDMLEKVGLLHPVTCMHAHMHSTEGDKHLHIS